jgi:hypothetical protein
MGGESFRTYLGPEMPDHEKTQRISDAHSFEQLYEAIEIIGFIKGSLKEYRWRELINLIHSVRQGENDILTITSSHGLRQKVEALLAPSNGPTDEPPPVLEAAIGLPLPDQRWLSAPESFQEFWEGLEAAEGLYIGGEGGKFYDAMDVRLMISEAIMGRMKPDDLPPELRQAARSILFHMEHGEPVARKQRLEPKREIYVREKQKQINQPRYLKR